MEKLRVVILGPPGVGKGTYASAISKAFGIPHISTGELLRREIAAGTELGMKARHFVERGLLVPDDIVNKVLCKFLSLEECKRGYVLDGYPRTISQATFLESVAPADAAIVLRASIETIASRLAGRLYCPACGRVYHATWRPPTREGLCDGCGAPLVRRPDDDPSVVAKRVRIYYEEVSEVVEFYGKLGKLLEFDADVDSVVGVPKLLSILAEKAAKITA